MTTKKPVQKSSFDDAISNIDKIISSLPDSSSDEKNSDKLVSQALNEVLQTSQNDNVEDIFGNTNVSQQRLVRYEIYEQIYDSVQLIKKIVRTYATNIVTSDPISDNILLVKELKDEENCYEHTEIAKNIIKHYNLEKRVQDFITPNMLKYGDCFVEIIDLKEQNLDFPEVKKKQIHESVAYEKLTNKSSNEYKNLNFDDIGDLIESFVEIDNNLELTNNETVLFESEQTPSFSRILLKYHSPHSVIVLLSDFDVILGYLEIREITKKIDNAAYSPLNQFVSLVQHMSTTNNITGNKDERNENTIELFSKSIVMKILEKNKLFYNKNSNYSETIKNKLEPEIYYALKKLLITSNKNLLFKNKLKIRFINASDMFQFKISGSNFWPYGTSILDSLVYPSKIYLLTQLSNCVTKLSRSSLIRKWTLETGSRKDVTSLVQKLRKNLRNQRTTVSDLLSSKDIPSILSDYRDMIALCAVQY